MFTSVSKIILVTSLLFATTLASSSDSSNSVSSDSSDSNDNQLDPVTIRVGVDVSALALMDMVGSVTAQLTAPAPEDGPTSDFDLDFNVMTIADVTVDIDSTPNGASSENIIETPVNVEMRIDVTNSIEADQNQNGDNGEGLIFQQFDEFDAVNTLIDIDVLNANDPDNVEVQERMFNNEVTRDPSMAATVSDADGAAGNIDGNVRSEASYAVIADGTRVAGNSNNQEAVISDRSLDPNRRRMQSPDPVTLTFAFQVNSRILERGSAFVNDGGVPEDTQVFLNLVVSAVSISEVTFDYSGVSGSFDNRQVNLEIDLNVTARSRGTADETATNTNSRLARVQGEIEGFSIGALRMMVLDITDPDNVQFLEPELEIQGVEISDVSFSTTIMGNPADVDIATSFDFERVTGQVILNTDVDTGAAPFVAERAMAEQGQQDLSDGNDDGDKVVIETIVLSQATKMNLYAMVFVIVLTCCVCGAVLWLTRSRQMKQRVAFDDGQADVIGV